MSTIVKLKAPARAMTIPLVTAILIAFSASAAFADAGDRGFPDNPIMAEQYFYDHQVQAEPEVATGQETPIFVHMKRKPIMHMKKKAHHPYYMPNH